MTQVAIDAMLAENVLTHSDTIPILMELVIMAFKLNISAPGVVYDPSTAASF